MDYYLQTYNILLDYFHNEIVKHSNVFVVLKHDLIKDRKLVNQ